ncbi:hypothetical protein BP6252_02131 [Coleophoma cylindrospora]|uniref:Ketopantoate reductase C-terminal domain-containing protein n=1 Tax=Coleophoma cylindrospora TaxID=1849047 RepID=A0A3D8SED2_9HELO|nr:hypothetical protein BP6252_02131 [Coleophoma cylindrospora]
MPWTKSRLRVSPLLRNISVSKSNESLVNEVTTDEPIYIFSTGPSAQFMVTALASGQNPPPLTFLTYSNNRIHEFRQAAGTVRILQDGLCHTAKDCEIELIPYSFKRYPDNASKTLQLEQLANGSPSMKKSSKFSSATTTVVEPRIQDLFEEEMYWPTPYLSLNSLKQRPRQTRSRNQLESACVNVQCGDEKASKQRAIQATDIPPAHKVHRRNLIIINEDPDSLIKNLSQLKETLDCRSTILVLNQSFSIRDKLIKIWPNVRDRPNLLLGILGHRAYMQRDGASSVEGSSKDTGGNFTSTVVRGGKLYIGPLVRLEEGESSAVSAQRQRDADYLLGHILGAQPLNAVRVNHSAINQLQLHGLLVGSVLGPLCALFEKPTCELFRGKGRYERAELADRLLQEAWPILVRFDRRLTIDKCARWLWKKTDVAYKAVPLMTRKFFQLKSSGTKHRNEWIIAKGESYGLDCPAHKLIVQQLNEKLVLLAAEKDWPQEQEMRVEWKKQTIERKSQNGQHEQVLLTQKKTSTSAALKCRKHARTKDRKT